MNLDGGLQLLRPSPYIPLPERERDLKIRLLAKVGGFDQDPNPLDPLLDQAL